MPEEQKNKFQMQISNAAVLRSFDTVSPKLYFSSKSLQ